MEKLKIGKVVQIDGNSIVIEVTEANISEKVNFRIGTNILPIVINKLVAIKLLNGKEVVAKIDKIYDKNHFKGIDDFTHKMGKIVIETSIIGIYDLYLKKFDEGINSFPLINSEVFSVSSDIKKEIVNIDSFYKLEIGNSYSSEDIVNEANPDVLLGKHLGIFGNTGTGKSCTVTSIIQGLKRRLKTSKNDEVEIKPKIIIFDSNNEYEQAFKNTEFKYKKINKEDLVLPHYKLSDSEYYKFFGASQGVQAPILKKTLKELRDQGQFSLEDINHKIDEIIKTASEKKVTGGKSTIDNWSYNQWKGWTNTMVNRIERVIENEKITNIINSTEINTIEKIKSNSETEIFLIDSDFDREELDIMMFLFSKLIYKNYQNSHNENIILVLEEAHRYINESERDDYKLGNYYIEKIAREGRKFGISLIISSQRPSEISKTVISQCNSYIVHKLTNKQDFEIISKLLSYNGKQYLNLLSSLEKQHALICGEAFGFADIVKIKEANPTPKSEDPKIVKNWII